MRVSGGLPAVEIESFSVEAPDYPLLRPFVVPVPRHRAFERCTAVAVRARRAYETTIGTQKAFPPRLHSRVERRIPRAAPVVTDLLFGGDELRCSIGRCELVGDCGATAYDAFEHEQRIAGDLYLPWSWPALPMWLGVAEISTTRSALRLSLRSRKRLRYPARYFTAAHAVLGALATALERVSD